MGNKKYKTKLEIGAAKKYNKKKHKYWTREEFVRWYAKQYSEQEGRCHYCDIYQEDIEKLVRGEKIKSKRFKRKNKFVRGITLEVERLDPEKEYNPANCKLACYFCNNDKSDIISEEHYIRFFKESRQNYINYLLKENKSSCDS